MLDALEAVAGPKVRGAGALRARRAHRRHRGQLAHRRLGGTRRKLGLQPHDDFADIIRQYIDDHPAAVTEAARKAAADYERTRRS